MSRIRYIIPASIVPLVLLVAASFLSANDKEDGSKEKELNAYGFKMKSLAGKEIDLSKYAGKVVLAVNVASQCGFTPQYAGLEELHKEYGDKGLVVLGFPCNQFGKQEPGSSQEIAEFCEREYQVTFDMFEKVEVNGNGACELYQFLTAQDAKPVGKGKVNWNFEKFLIGKDGKVVARFRSNTSPDDKSLIEQIEQQLAEKQ